MAGEGIEFESLSKRYAGVEALADFNLKVGPGEFVTLLGPSGSGKTTALNILAGFIEPDAGDVRLGGKSLLALPPEARRLGMVFQGYTLFPHMNVFDNIAFPLRLRKVSAREIRQKVGAMLEMVRLESLANRMPKELSGGQQQRVAFARAVVAEPSVLLMDEPLGALDLKLRQSMQLEIKRYHAALGCTILFVTHDQEEALALSNRVAVMGGGRIQQVDTPDRIYDQPNSRYVAEFIGKTNILTWRDEGDGTLAIVETGNRIALDASRGIGGGLFSVRPEKITRTKTDEADWITFGGVVCDVLFLGNVVQYGVRTVRGAIVLFQEHRGARLPVLRLSEVIELNFRVEDALRVGEG